MSAKLKLKATLTNLGANTHGVMRRLRDFSGRWRFEEADLIWDLFEATSNLKPGTMIDVGACYGEIFSPFLSNGWTVFAFEPDPNPSKISTLSKFSRSHLKLFDLAVSDKAGIELPFFASAESEGISSLSAFTQGHKPVKTVTTTTLAHVVAEQKITSVDFLKIDTEGHDLFVLKGFPWESKESHPRVILCEFEDRKTMPLGYTHQDLGNYLMGLGYNVFLSEWHPILKYGMQHRWRKISQFPTALESSDGWGNLIATKPDLTPTLINLIKKTKTI